MKAGVGGRRHSPGTPGDPAQQLQEQEGPTPSTAGGSRALPTPGFGAPSLQTVSEQASVLGAPPVWRFETAVPQANTWGCTLMGNPDAPQVQRGLEGWRRWAWLQTYTGGFHPPTRGPRTLVVVGGAAEDTQGWV